MYEYKAKIVRIIDGDTVVAVVDLGFKIKHEITIRLAGINVPEITTPEGLATAKYLIETILDKEVTLRTSKDRKEKYGRYLGTIWFDLATISFNDLLVNAKLATRYR